VIASLKLVRYSGAPDGTQHAWPVTIRAVGTNIASEIFVHRAVKAGDPFDGDGFSCVASAQQMYELPAKRSLVLSSKYQLPFYRSAQLEVLARSQAEADAIWQYVNEDVKRLLDNYNVATDAVPVETSFQQGQVRVAPASNLVAPVADTAVANRIIIPVGKPILAQAAAPHAAQAAYTWIQLNSDGQAIRAYEFMSVADGYDGTWHCRSDTLNGDILETEEFKVPPTP